MAYLSQTWKSESTFGARRRACEASRISDIERERRCPTVRSDAYPRVAFPPSFLLERSNNNYKPLSQISTTDSFSEGPESTDFISDHVAQPILRHGRSFSTQGFCTNSTGKGLLLWDEPRCQSVPAKNCGSLEPPAEVYRQNCRVLASFSEDSAEEWSVEMNEPIPNSDNSANPFFSIVIFLTNHLTNGLAIAFKLLFHLFILTSNFAFYRVKKVLARKNTELQAHCETCPTDDSRVKMERVDRGTHDTTIYLTNPSLDEQQVLLRRKLFESNIEDVTDSSSCTSATSVKTTQRLEEQSIKAKDCFIIGGVTCEIMTSVDLLLNLWRLLWWSFSTIKNSYKKESQITIRKKPRRLTFSPIVHNFNKVMLESFPRLRDADTAYNFSFCYLSMTLFVLNRFVSYSGMLPTAFVAASDLLILSVLARSLWCLVSKPVKVVVRDVTTGGILRRFVPPSIHKFTSLDFLLGFICDFVGSGRAQFYLTRIPMIVMLITDYIPKVRAIVTKIVDQPAFVAKRESHSILAQSIRNVHNPTVDLSERNRSSGESPTQTAMSEDSRYDDGAIVPLLPESPPSPLDMELEICLRDLDLELEELLEGSDSFFLRILGGKSVFDLFPDWAQWAYQGHKTKYKYENRENTRIPANLLKNNIPVSLSHCQTSNNPQGNKIATILPNPSSLNHRSSESAVAALTPIEKAARTLMRHVLRKAGMKPEPMRSPEKRKSQIEAVLTAAYGGFRARDTSSTDSIFSLKQHFDDDINSHIPQSTNNQVIPLKFTMAANCSNFHAPNLENASHKSVAKEHVRKENRCTMTPKALEQNSPNQRGSEASQLHMTVELIKSRLLKNPSVRHYFGAINLRVFLFTLLMIGLQITKLSSSRFRRFQRRLPTWLMLWSSLALYMSLANFRSLRQAGAMEVRRIRRLGLICLSRITLARNSPNPLQ